MKSWDSIWEEDEEAGMGAFIKDGLEGIAGAIQRLGNAEACTDMGALEALGAVHKDGLEAIADAIAHGLSEIADAIGQASPWSEKK
jgi:hypothetical protein